MALPPNPRFTDRPFNFLAGKAKLGRTTLPTAPTPAKKGFACACAAAAEGKRTRRLGTRDTTLPSGSSGGEQRTMKTLLVIAAALAALSSPALASATTPRVLLGTWCVYDATSETQEGVTLYKRRGQCETAEDSIVIAPDRMFVAGEVGCKLLEVEAARGAWRLLHSCRHVSSGDHFVSDAWYSLSDPNTLRVQNVAG
jgi:hypothetical protein